MAAITMSVNTFSKIPENDLSANKKPENAKRASGSSGSYTVSTSAARITFQSHKSRKEPPLSKKPEKNKNHKESQHRQLPNTDNLKSNFIVSKNPSYKARMQINAGPLPPANGKLGFHPGSTDKDLKKIRTGTKKCFGTRLEPNQSHRKFCSGRVRCDVLKLFMVLAHNLGP